MTSAAAIRPESASGSDHHGPIIRVRITGFRDYSKNTLVGFCDLELIDAGVVIKDALYHEKTGAAWFGMPARKDQQGEWRPMVTFSSKRHREAFQDAARRALEAWRFSQEVNPETSDGGTF